MINTGGSDNVERIKKVDGIKEPLGLHNYFSQRILRRAIFLLAPAANHG